VNDIFETVDRGDFALAALVGASNDEDFIVLSDGDGADVVFFSELLAQWCAHDCSSDTGWSIVMGFAGLSPRGVEGGVDLRHLGDCGDDNWSKLSS